MRTILSALIALFSLTGSTARADAFTAVEGYVFNHSTGRPVAGAAMLLDTCSPNFVAAAASTTDQNGFYSYTIGFLANIDATYRKVIAECKTPKGVVRSSIPVYTRIAPGLYRRDLYLNLNSRTHSCLPHDVFSDCQLIPSQ